jgi:hypothetical protein
MRSCAACDVEVSTLSHIRIHAEVVNTVLTSALHAPTQWLVMGDRSAVLIPVSSILYAVQAGSDLACLHG